MKGKVNSKSEDELDSCKIILILPNFRKSRLQG